MAERALASRHAPSRKDDAELLEEARERFQLAEEAESEWRAQAIDDWRFYAGEQWDEALLQERNADGRPCMVINRLKQFAAQVINEQRQNHPSIRVQPVDSQADIATAKILQGLIRHIEVSSDADSAYATAFEHAVIMGRGYFRVLTDYVSPVSFEQTILIRRLRNPFCVYMDPSAQQADYGDARWGFVVETVSRSAFLATYDVEPQDLDAWGASGDAWVTRDTVRVAEYFTLEEEDFPVVLLASGEVAPRDALEDGRTMDVVEERTARLPVVWWYKLNGYTVLSRTRWPGRYIPIIPVLGSEVDLDGRVDYSGIVRGAKDAQRAYNYMAPLALDTPLPTPHGWTTMGEVEPGDWLFNEQGKPCQVLGLSPIFTKHACFKVTFDDGSSIIADGDHRWTVERRGAGHKVHRDATWKTETLPTRMLMKHRYYLWNTRPLDLPDDDLPIDPYVLGVWLGDGSTAEPRITSGDADVKEMRELLETCGMTLSRGFHQPGAWTFTLLGVRRQFVRLGLLGAKHIPPSYLRASAAQRLALLQGLMDTDGTVGTNGQCVLTTTLPRLRDDVTELLHSLGLKVRIFEQSRPARVYPNGATYQPATTWTFSFSPPEGLDLFRLERKRVAQGRRERFTPRRTQRREIVRLELVPSVPVRCLAIDSPSHLFLAGTGMIPTHNSAESEAIGLAPRAPFIGAEGQFSGYEDEWMTANVRNHAYLQYRPTPNAPPPQRQMFEPAVQAITQSRMLAAEDMKAVTGLYDASLGAKSNETSGKAISARQQEGDTATAHYFDNFARALKHTGRILVDLIPRIYGAPRVVRIIGEDGEGTPTPLNQPVLDPQTGVQQIYNVGVGTFDVVVDVGPSYQTRREQAVDQLTQLVQAFPPLMDVAGDLLIGAMDIPKAQEIAMRLQGRMGQGAPGQNGEGGEGGQAPPQLMQELTQMAAKLQELQQENQQLQMQAQAQAQDTQLKQQELALKAGELQLKQRQLELDAAQQRAELALKEQQFLWERAQPQAVALVAPRDGAAPQD